MFAWALTKGREAPTIPLRKIQSPFIQGELIMGFVTRRTILQNGACGVLMLFTPGLHPQIMETVTLPHEALRFTPAFAEPVLAKVRDLAEHPGKKIRLEFPDLLGAKKSVYLWYERTRRRGVLYPVLHSEGHRPLRLMHNGEAPLHEIEFTSHDQGLMGRLKNRFKVLWGHLKEWMQRQDNFTLAIKAVAAAVAVWFVASIGYTVLAGIAFIASYALIIGLIIAGVLVIAELFPGLHLIRPRQERATRIYIKKTERFSDVVGAVAA